MATKRIAPVPGQESVWDYPRPPRMEAVPDRIQVVFAGLLIAESSNALRILETSHPPTIYIPREDIRMEFLAESARSSYCEWKGRASYLHLVAEGELAEDAAWTYLKPSPSYATLADCVAFYPGRMDACYVGEERVKAQPGGFYGGWVTSRIIGPFKGDPGTWGW